MELRLSYSLFTASIVLFTLNHFPVLCSKCDTCKSIARKFTEGLEKTSKSNFGGGNTNWEERKLGTYASSETRLLEILDQCCDEKECHYMLEENEEILEEWWFTDYAKNKQDNLLESFCIKELKVCCPENTYGKKCQPCPGGKERPCSGNGRCQGSGARDGEGTCQCDLGYDGTLCDTCSVGYFKDQSSNDTHIVCAACHRSCNTTCSGSAATECESCREGWIMNETEGCVDVDECVGETKLCADHKFCENTEGAYLCQDCDISCNGCTGAGADKCASCAERYYLDDSQTCSACHPSCRTTCTDATPLSCDVCASGWIFMADKGCQDIDECAKGRFECAKNTYCLNTEGSYVCKACHETCSGCTGPGPTDCMLCSAGYKRSEDLKECVDIDECVVDEKACSNVGEKCVNTIGSHKCVCLEEYVMVRGKCQLKNKSTSKNKKKRKDKDSATNTETPPSPPVEGEKNFEGRVEENLEGFQEVLREVGAPIPGVPLEDSVVMGGQFEREPIHIPSEAEPSGASKMEETKVKSEDKATHPKEEL